MSAGTVTCSLCGFSNRAPQAHDHCVSCGAKLESLPHSNSRRGGDDRHRPQEGFSFPWFAVALGVTTVLTGAIIVGLPLVVSAVDLEGSAGMLVAIPVWFAAGFLVGLIAPARTFIEPVLATFLVAIPTALFLLRSQTVKTMPFWVYILMSVLGVLFSLIGAYLGERIQLGPRPMKSLE